METSNRRSDKKVPCEDCISFAICLAKIIWFDYKDLLWMSVDIDEDLRCKLIDEFTGRKDNDVSENEYSYRVDMIMEFYIKSSNKLKTTMKIKTEENGYVLEKWKDMLK